MNWRGVEQSAAFQVVTSHRGPRQADAQVRAVLLEGSNSLFVIPQFVYVISSSVNTFDKWIILDISIGKFMYARVALLASGSKNIKGSGDTVLSIIYDLYK